MQRLLFRITCIIAVGVIFSVQLSGQNIPSGTPVDKVVAVVGDDIILLSDVQGQLMYLRQQNPKIDLSDKSYYDKAVERLIDEKLVIAHAMQDTAIKVADEEVEERMEFHIQSIVRQVGSEKRVEEVYGMSVARLKSDFREEIRRQLKAERLRQMRFGEMKVSPLDVEDYYKKYKDSLPKVPTEVELYHIVRFVESSAEARATTFELAKKVRDSLLAGGNFAEFAKRYSADSYSGARGGELGFNERGKFVPEFEKAAYALQPGEISLPVESPFGVHIIQLIEKNENSVNTRHILFRLGQTSNDVESTKKFLDSLRNVALKEQNFEFLAKAFSDDEQTRAFGGYLQRQELQRLPPAFRAAEKLKDGEISEPAQYVVPGSTKSAYHIVWRKQTIQEHPITLESDYKRVEQAALYFKKNTEYEAWISSLRKTIFWERKDNM